VARRRPRNSYEDYRGLFAASPALALAFALFLTALAGLPPGLIGLIAKVVVFRAIISGQVVWLAIVMGLNTVIALYYYVRWAAVLFDTDGIEVRKLAVPGVLRAALAITAAAAVVLGAYPQWVLHAVPGLR
jgi:NADH-quinone oxidoreductase subunit N